MQKLFLLLLILPLFSYTQNFKTPFEKGNGNTTAQYSEIISHYEALAKKFKKNIRIETVGVDDNKFPIHLISIKNPKSKKNKVSVFINNGIHPGEPEGIDASMMLARDLVTLPEMQSLLNNVDVYIIPIYNVGGCLNRNSFSRTNQNGPESYGFRGNAKNFDLNRDFVKADTKNTLAFYTAFRKIEPHIFVDTHTSDGADYQYTTTYITSQKDKMNESLSKYMIENINPELKNKYKKLDKDLFPYVDVFKEIPDSGIVGFLETARFSSGYAALFNCMPYVLETHMLKKFDLRVNESYLFLKSIIEIASEKNQEIIDLKNLADESEISKSSFGINYYLDSSKYSVIDFKGYYSAYKKSEVSGTARLYYDTGDPYTKKIKFYNNYKPGKVITKPMYYILPSAYDNIAKLLLKNKIEVNVLKVDTQLKVESTYISEYETASKPYEGHYPHYNVITKARVQNVQFQKGDYIIDLNNQYARYLITILEANSNEGFFVWNYFDAILNQKEYFSDFVFDELAGDLLKKDVLLSDKFKERKSKDILFQKNPPGQLDFIYKNSKFYENTHLRYPVFKYNIQLDPTLISKIWTYSE